MAGACSYQGTVLFSCTDEHGPIDIVEEPTTRSMHFGTMARQSTMYLADPNALVLEYTRYMAGTLLLVDEPRRILMLGLGGGSLARFMLAQYARCRVDVVEIRQRVVDLAHGFFYLPNDLRLSIHVMPAERFLAAPQPCQYDLILVDLFNGHGMASAHSHPTFYAQCRQCLAPGGALTTNLWTGGRRASLRQITRDLYTAFSGRLLDLPVAGKQNTVLYALPALPDRRVWSRARQRAGAWGERAGVDYPALIRALEQKAVQLR